MTCINATHEAQAMPADISAQPGAAVQVRLKGPLYQALENWRRSQPKIPPRAEALREILERALAEHQPGAA
jgi:hypothetical protein